jgi:hypothetical protein
VVGDVGEVVVTGDERFAAIVRIMRKWHDESKVK